MVESIHLKTAHGHDSMYAAIIKAGGWVQSGHSHPLIRGKVDIVWKVVQETLLPPMNIAAFLFGM